MSESSIKKWRLWFNAAGQEIRPPGDVTAHATPHIGRAHLSLYLFRLNSTRRVALVSFNDTDATI